jgi:hypothetical protein
VDVLAVISTLVSSVTLAVVLGVAFKSGKWAGRIEEKIAALERAILPEHGG